ncbi:unnamed protein product (macronuclear) [Paramecium tetraurelia]|uniref:Transmembrane protein n=1 Tax=Paramecium tetraurelia TaxID=5888 RepID=A0D278_PARTE|nr:uncharacterized protein GSPATT00012651001 [Paramecium tetraurelia]CAK77145.1 unnamed protein product [Paramecium tetraurelia]|eukprot:XP_001444542.1 hypothetical protein (macronuclear) [Paramecium tetraurelia strain d4-2]
MNPRMTMNNRGQQPQQQNGLRNDYQSVVQGIQSLMGISFSAVQLCIFGSMLMEKTKKLLEFFKSGAVTSINKLLTLLRIKQFLKGELTMTQIGKSVVNTSTQIGKQWIIAIRLLLLVVILLIGALLAHMKKKIKEKQEIEVALKQQEIEEAEQQQQLDNQVDTSQLPIQQNDFWNHSEENTSNQEQQPLQQQLSNPVPTINYLNDLPGFSNTGNPSKPWMK